MGEQARQVIGIDLGSSGCSVAVATKSGPSIVADDRGHTRPPALLTVLANGRQLFGEDAKAQTALNSRNTATWVKQLLGASFSDESLGALRKRVAFPILPGPGDTVRVELGGQRFDGEQIVALFVERLVGMATEYLGAPVHAAVLAAPADFSVTQRRALVKAATSDKLEVLRVMHDPSAAALGFGLQGRVGSAPRRVGVYDLGGGHFQFSVVEVGGNTVRLLGARSRLFIGGDAFDQRVVDWIVERAKESGVDPSGDVPALQRVRQVAEHVKCALSDGKRAKISLPHLGGENRDVSAVLTRDTLERLVNDLVSETFTVCGEALSSAAVNANGLDALVVCGQQSRMPLVQRRVAELFDREPERGVDPGEAIALGAASYGAQLLTEQGA